MRTGADAPGTGGSGVDLSAARWRKSTRSAISNCVEIAFVDGHVAVRNSRDRGGPALLFSSAEWQAFLGGVRNGEFDLP